jgi:membrane fusion protein (multidrug efflux system)
VIAVVLLPLLGAWAAWLVRGEVALYEVTAVARLEVQSAAHQVTAVVPGRVIETRLRLGQKVQAGDVLVVLDAEAEQRALQEKRRRRQALLDRLPPLAREIDAERVALLRLEQARQAAREEARAQTAEAGARADDAARRAQTSRRLGRVNAIKSEELRHDLAEAEARRAAELALQQGAVRLERDRDLLESERRARLARLERTLVELRGEAAVEAAALRRLEHDLALRTLRAPVAGWVGEVAEVRSGTVVQVAQRLGAIVPPGERRAVAWFPVAALGRLRPGQPARLRLDGFPWTQYGTLAARVADVGSEPVDGRARVELILAQEQEARIPIEHGMTGSAEVEVERLSPAALVLRAAGQLLAGR